MNNKKRFSIMHSIIISALVLLILNGCGSNGNGGESETCNDIKEASRALVDSYQQCSQGDSCTFVDMYEYAGNNNCLSAFQCSKALRNGSDLEAFRTKVQALEQDFETCTECATASCVPVSEYEAFCNIEEGKCDWRSKTTTQ